MLFVLCLPSPNLFHFNLFVSTLLSVLVPAPVIQAWSVTASSNEVVSFQPETMAQEQINFLCTLNVHVITKHISEWLVILFILLKNYLTNVFAALCVTFMKKQSMRGN